MTPAVIPFPDDLHEWEPSGECSGPSVYEWVCVKCRSVSKGGPPGSSVDSVSPCPSVRMSAVRRVHDS